LGWRCITAGSSSAAFLAFVAASFLLTPYLGRNFFPSVDAGQILMHARAPIGMRVEETANRFADIEKEIRRVIPSHEIATMVDNIGVPVSGINLTYNNTGTIAARTARSRSSSRRSTGRPPTMCASSGSNFRSAFRDSLFRSSLPTSSVRS